MAQSRPPPVRTQSPAASPPPLSPRTQDKEKKHHTRRKSGKDYVVIIEKKTSRPAPLSRKSTIPQYASKPVPGIGRREREHDDEEQRRDSGEGFPQFCMTCEKQFLPANDTFLYCSESCRIHDQAPPPPAISTRTHSYPYYAPTSPPLTPYARHFSAPSHEDGPDIVPRLSPTQSRPRSYFNSDPYPQTYEEPSHVSTSPPHTNGYNNSQSSTALASLRELATGLPKTSYGRPESPPKSSASSINRPSSGVWNYIPFTSGSKTATPTPSCTPGNSYTSPSHTPYNVSQSYGAYAANGYARSKEDLYAYGKSQATTTAGYYGTTGLGMDRPLPPRSGPGGYGHRPRSIDLVTPFSGAH